MLSLDRRSAAAATASWLLPAAATALSVCLDSASVGPQATLDADLPRRQQAAAGRAGGGGGGRDAARWSPLDEDV
jgi:hypothetical protein